MQSIRLAQDLTRIQSGSAAYVILCPWLQRFAGKDGIWLSVLAAHDANQALLDALPAGRKQWPSVYAGVFAADMLRSTRQLILHFKRAGIGGVVNLPSVSFIDGEAGAVFESLSLGIDRETDFLAACAKAGLRIGAIVGSRQAAQKVLDIGVDFLLAQDGPPTRDGNNRSKAVVDAITRLASPYGVPVISLSKLAKSKLA